MSRCVYQLRGVHTSLIGGVGPGGLWSNFDSSSAFDGVQW